MFEFEILGKTISFVWDFIDYGTSPFALLEAFLEFVKNLFSGVI